MGLSLSPLVIASHNAGKVREIRVLLAPLGIEVTSSGELGISEPEETGNSFEANATLKALHTLQQSGKASLSDDSGIVVEGLNGAPGIYSARWAGPDKNWRAAFDRIHKELSAKNNEPEGASAYFICTLCLALPDGTTVAFEGKVHGTLTFPARGNKGFGYDPIFVPQGGNQTFGEIEPEVKQSMSHRTKAFEKFVDYLKEAQ